MTHEEVPGQGVIQIAYGKGTIPLRADPELAEWHVIRPNFAPPLADAEGAFRAACRNPIGSKPLRELIRPGERVVIVTSDGTRAVPNRQLIPWLLRELPVPAEQVTVLLGNGSHRANTPAEIAGMFGEDVVRRVRILNHDAFAHRRNAYIGQAASGNNVYLDKLYVETDRRIVVGFIEPHVHAGFSGGAKGVVPGVASIDTILRIHGFDLIAHPLSTWGTVEDNPIRQELEAMVCLCPPDFLVNITLNSAKEITAVFTGDYIAAHRLGCARSKEEAMQPVQHTFPVVITSNSGYPLDQNLYQAIKGVSAGASITERGGVVFIVSECSDGIPDHGNFGTLMRVGGSPDDILQHIVGLQKEILDQWAVQVSAYLMQRYDIRVYSAMSRKTIESCKLKAVEGDLQAAVEAEIRKLGPRPRVAVVPYGPLTIPYVTT